MVGFGHGNARVKYFDLVPNKYDRLAIKLDIFESVILDENKRINTLSHKGEKLILGIIFLHLQLFLKQTFKGVIEEFHINQKLEIIGTYLFEFFFDDLVDI